jgi:alpha-tubulin suppressor-like RCC1 family protein
MLGHNDIAICREKHTFERMDPVCFSDFAVTMVAAGASHCIANTHSNNAVWTWGLNDSGQLGDGTNNNMDAPFLIPNAAFENGAVASIHAGHDYSMVVTEAGGLFSCGNGKCGILGLGNQLSYSTFQRVGGQNSTLFGPRGVRTVACGAMHTIMLAKDNAL